MSKQDLLAERDRGELMGAERERVVKLFGDHFRLASSSMSPEHAAATAHDAVQRHLASNREAEEMRHIGGGGI